MKRAAVAVGAWLVLAVLVILAVGVGPGTFAPIDAWSAVLGGGAASPTFGAIVREIRLPRTLLADGVDPDVLAGFEAGLAVLRERGATFVDIELPHARYAIPVYYLVCTAEASSNLARYDGVKYGYRSPAARDSGLKTMYMKTRDEGFGAEVKRRIMLGTYALSSGYIDAYYLKALKVRRLIKNDFDQAFAQCDVVLSPTSPTPA